MRAPSSGVFARGVVGLFSICLRDLAPSPTRTSFGRGRELADACVAHACPGASPSRRDGAALKKEMAKPQYDKTIAENSRIAQALGMQGTPGFIVDSRVNFGYVPADGLKSMIADIRKEGCKVC